MFTSNYNPVKLIFMMTKTLLWNFLIFVQSVLMSLYLFLPPLPRLSTSFHLHLFFLAKLQTMLSVDKIHKCKRYDLSTRIKTGFEYTFTENIYEISLCWEECLCDVSPMIIQGAWTRPMPGQPEENLLKSFSQTIYLQLCISIIHWNKYHVIVLPYTPTFCSWAWLKAIMPFSNRALTTKNYCHIYHSVSIIWRCYSISDGILS